MSHHTNIVRIKVVAAALGKLNQKIVFVGGATISLYSERQVFEVRPTDDVDVLIEILSYGNRIDLEERLRVLGFSIDIESGIVCRYKVQGITVDIMPTDDPSIGFSNKWYPEGFRNSLDYFIDDSCTIRILSAPYFLVTKFEAFKGRGGSDGRMSQDFEDIIFILENRMSIWEEINTADKEVKKFLCQEFSNLLNHPHHLEWIAGHTERGVSSSAYSIIQSVRTLINESDYR